MAKETKDVNVNVNETVNAAEEILKVSGEVVPDLPAVVPDQQPSVPQAPSTNLRLMKNIGIGAGIAGTGCLALYGLYELGKKGVKFLKDRKQKKIEANNMEHPEYDYKKVEDPKKEDENAPKAKGKNPIGFLYTPNVSK